MPVVALARVEQTPMQSCTTLTVHRGHTHVVDIVHLPVHFGGEVASRCDPLPRPRGVASGESTETLAVPLGLNVEALKGGGSVLIDDEVKFC